MLKGNFQKKELKILNILLAASILCAQTSALALEQTGRKRPIEEKNKSVSLTRSADPLSLLGCDAAFNKAALTKVDSIVRDSFYSIELSKTVWPKALSKQKEKILAARDLIELSVAINQALDELKTSHCRFLTINDDTYYFLNSLFLHGKNEDKAKSAFPGFITGGVGFAPDVVRFVLDGSPAFKAGIHVGDKIVSVNGSQLIGQANFFGADISHPIVVFKRNSKPHCVQLNIHKVSMYEMYSEAVTKSVRRFDKDDLHLGYVHLWCGGHAAQEALADTLDREPLKDCDGLILDLRDGYGACSLDALDPFYRQPAAYPDFEMISREGKKTTNRIYFDKPLVALINGGSRSGKEMLAFSLEKTKRAQVIGERTAGYFVAGQLFKINDLCALYLAVSDCSLSGTRLEGTGVEPDLKVANDKTKADDRQLEAAKDELVKRIKSEREKEESSPAP